MQNLVHRCTRYFALKTTVDNKFLRQMLTNNHVSLARSQLTADPPLLTVYLIEDTTCPIEDDHMQQATRSRSEDTTPEMGRYRNLCPQYSRYTELRQDTTKSQYIKKDQKHHDINHDICHRCN